MKTWKRTSKKKKTATRRNLGEEGELFQAEIASEQVRLRTLHLSLPKRGELLGKKGRGKPGRGKRGGGPDWKGGEVGRKKGS